MVIIKLRGLWIWSGGSGHLADRIIKLPLGGRVFLRRRIIRTKHFTQKSTQLKESGHILLCLDVA